MEKYGKQLEGRIAELDKQTGYDKRETKMLSGEVGYSSSNKQEVTGVSMDAASSGKIEAAAAGQRFNFGNDTTFTKQPSDSGTVLQSNTGQSFALTRNDDGSGSLSPINTSNQNGPSNAGGSATNGTAGTLVSGTNTATSGTPVSGTNTATAGTPVSGGNTAAPVATQGDDSGAGEKQGTEGDQTVQGQQNADVARTANDVSNASPAQQQAGTNTATSGTPVSGTNTATAGTPVSGGNTAAPVATQGDDSGAGEKQGTEGDQTVQGQQNADVAQCCRNDVERDDRHSNKLVLIPLCHSNKAGTNDTATSGTADRVLYAARAGARISGAHGWSCSATRWPTTVAQVKSRELKVIKLCKASKMLMFTTANDVSNASPAQQQAGVNTALSNGGNAGTKTENQLAQGGNQAIVTAGQNAASSLGNNNATAGTPVSGATQGDDSGAGEKQGTEGDQTVQGQQNADVARTANDVSNSSPAQQQAGTNTTMAQQQAGTNTATAAHSSIRW